MSDQYNYAGYGGTTYGGSNNGQGGSPPRGGPGGPGGGGGFQGGPQRGYGGGAGGGGGRRPGPYDDHRGGGGGGGDFGPRDGGWGGARGGGGGRRRSASPDFGRGGGRGGPPGRRFDGPGGGGGYGGGRDGGYGGGPPRGGPGGGGMGMGMGGPGDRGAPIGRMDLGDPFRRRGEPGDRDESEVIRQRVNRERPCRTLFVRNLKFGLVPEDVRRPFAEIGDIRTFFDLVEKRAMAFITYYDARAAMMAKDRLHNFPLMGRPMDVHYSLPRDADLAQPCDREKGQGTLSIVIRNAPPGMNPSPSEQEIFQRFAPFGDIKIIFPDPQRPDIKLIEYFDSRGAAKAYDNLNGTPFAGGALDLHFEWDKPAPAPPPMAQAPPMPSNGGFGYQQPAVNAFGQPVGGYGAPPPPGTATGYGYGGGSTPIPGSGGAPPPPPQGPPQGAPPQAPGAASHGVEQAKKMQDLLASLVSNQGLVASLAGGAQQQPYGSAPPAPAPAVVPGAPALNLGYPSYAPTASSAPPAPAPAPPVGAAGMSPLPPAIGSPLGAAGLPAAVTSLLAQAAGQAPPPPQQQQQQQYGGYSPLPPAAGAGAPPPQPPAAAAAPTQGQAPGAEASAPAQVQALLALLQQQKAQQQ